MRRAWLIVIPALFAGSCGLGTPACDDPRGGCNDPDAAAMMWRSLGEFRQSNLAARPPLGTPAAFHQLIVSGVDNFIEGPRGKTGDTWVEERIMDPSFQGCVLDTLVVPGSHVCGVQLFSPVTFPSGTHMLQGDLVDVSGGQYEEFNCATCSSTFPNGRTLPEFGTPNLIRIGSAASPTPIPLHYASIYQDGDQDVGVLVQIIEPLEVSGTWDSGHGELPIDLVPNTNQNVVVTNQIGEVDGPSLVTVPPTWVCVSGIISYFYGPKVLARGMSDIRVLGTTPPAAGTSCVTM